MYANHAYPGRDRVQANTTDLYNTAIGYLTPGVRLVYNTLILEYEQVMPHTPSRRYMR